MSIKRLDPNARYRVIAPQDEALDSESPEELKALEIALAEDEKSDSAAPKRNPTRYEKYIEQFDESCLRFKEGAKPTRFVLRALRNAETAMLNAKYYTYDTVSKRATNKDLSLYSIEVFGLAVLGIEEENEEGKTVPSKISSEELSLATVMEVAGCVTLLGQLGASSKKG